MSSHGATAVAKATGAVRSDVTAPGRKVARKGSPPTADSVGQLKGAPGSGENHNVSPVDIRKAPGPQLTPVEREAQRIDRVLTAVWEQLGIEKTGRILGQGAFGRVEEAVGTKGNLAGRKVVVKTMFPRASKTTGALKPTTTSRVHGEASAILLRDHQSCLKTHFAIVRDQGEIYNINTAEKVQALDRDVQILAVVSDFVEGREIPKTVAPTERHAVRVALDLADALKTMHHQGFVYHDLKPENVLIDKE